MGSSRPRNSKRVRKAHSAKRSSPSPRRKAGKPSFQTTPRIPPAVEIALDVQRGSLEIAISLMYCLHATLRHQADDGGLFETEGLEDAAGMADVADISALLLVRLDAIHDALDPTELVRAKVDQEAAQLTETVREMFDSEVAR